MDTQTHYPPDTDRVFLQDSSLLLSAQDYADLFAQLNCDVQDDEYVIDSLPVGVTIIDEAEFFDRYFGGQQNADSPNYFEAL